MKIAVVTGGTGGHIFPALSLEKELKKNPYVEKIIFVAAATSLSKWVLEKRRDIVSIPSRGFVGKRFHEKILAVALILAGLFKSLLLLKRENPDIACGFGGYGTLPFFLACRFLRIPFVLHEQNLIPGRSTRFLSRFSKEVLISFPETKYPLPNAKTVFIGNLPREDFIHYHYSLKSSGYKPEDKKLVLVIGGSQGSRFLNQNAPRPLLKILNDFPDLSIVHISGEREQKAVETLYRNEARARVMGFCLDMLSLFKQARLVISRAGATILSELSLCGVPSILIPFAKSADNHQYHNALWFRERGGCLLIEERDFTESFFYNTVRDLLKTPSQLVKMSEVLVSLARPDATKNAVERILKC
jgi:UDP-N-acetylglucosamine--N-acetylmuramyl-(pentapeptide) pyrophosphoryl-undecaprenol N-acetylglucosamine transferase